MQIRLTQGDLELAVADYIVKMGITRPIGEINFTASRGDAGIITEVELIDTPAAMRSAPAVVTTEVVADPVREEAVTPPVPAEVVAAKANGKAAPEEAATGVKAKSLFGG